MRETSYDLELWALMSKNETLLTLKSNPQSYGTRPGKCRALVQRGITVEKGQRYRSAGEAVSLQTSGWKTPTCSWS